MQIKTNILDTYNFCNNKYLTKEQERIIITKAKLKDKTSINILIQNNLKLITKIATKHIRYGVPINDLIQEGIIGLMEAIEKFNLNYDCKFITYAYYKINEKIKRAIANDSRTIRIPIQMHELHIKYKQVLEEYERNDKQPTNKELASILNVTPNYIDRIKQIDNNITSINTYITEDETKELIDTIAADDISIEEQVITKCLKDDINKLLKDYDLNKLDIEIIKYRFGFYNNRSYTYNEIAKILKISVNTVRKYYQRAINRFRELDYTKNLIEYAYDVEHAKNILDKYD